MRSNRVEELCKTFYVHNINPIVVTLKYMFGAIWGNRTPQH
jgi:hypothetical protein